MCCVFHDQLLYHFHPQLIQCLNPEDYPQRRQFYECFLHQSAVVPDFASCVLFSDELAFTRDSVFNTHNQHIMDQINPVAFTVRLHQVTFSINIWCGSIHSTLLGPHVMTNILTGAHYKDFLVNTLSVLLDEVPLVVCARTWFQHDGAPAHFSHLEKQPLMVTFGDRWMGHLGPVPWPARSPDLNPLEFVLWGHLKALVYTTPVDHVDDLLPRIVDSCNNIRTTPGLLEWVRQSMLLHYQLCFQERGISYKLFRNAVIAKGYCLFWFCFLLFVCSEWLLQLNNACYDETSVAP